MSRFLALVYGLVYSLALPAIIFRLLRSPGGANLARRFGFGITATASECIWLHASSVGEVALLEPIVAALGRTHPQTKLLITAYTSTGQKTARSRFPQHLVQVLPFDYRFCIRRYIRSFNPRLVVIVESEFWPALLGELNNANVPVAVLNGKMSERSMMIHAKTRFVAESIRSIAVWAMQDEVNAERVTRLGAPADRVHVTGNMKYDLVAPEHGGVTRESLGISESAFVIVGGSLHDEEHESFLDSVFRPQPVANPVVAVLAPRYTQSSAVVAAAADARGLRSVLRTQLSGTDKREIEYDVCIIDTFGELRALYSIADAVFVGGSLFDRGRSRGGHNLMEPAICAVPVLFGPHNYSFAQVARELGAAGGGRLVRSTQELREALVYIASDPEIVAQMGAAAREVVVAGQGATARNLALLGGLLEPRRH